MKEIEFDRRRPSRLQIGGDAGPAFAGDPVQARDQRHRDAVGGAPDQFEMGGERTAVSGCGGR